MTMVDAINSPSGGQAGTPEGGVVGVAATRTRSAPHPRRPANWRAMHRYATLIAEHTPMRALSLPLTHRDPGAIAAHLTDRSTGLDAIVLIGPDGPASAHIAAAVHRGGGPTVISELDVLTVALGAAALTCLRRRSIAPRSGRIAVTGADSAPRLGPLLAALGAGPMTTWHRHDIDPHRLPAALAGLDLLIDLDNSVARHLGPPDTLRLPEYPFEHTALILPGLLNGLHPYPRTLISVDILAACSRALALITPAGRTLPRLYDRLLDPAVARHVTRTLDPRTSQQTP
ncbi:hypothetical protein [Mycolicibacterium fortuitum]|uniref:hypothetical protein n=1 Tax=Mycolicibacterium fortuitum TaxID=1766 RepID=UPI00262ED209|nr:hypothetical protein [Mycolicibacterium fortuitum]